MFGSAVLPAIVAVTQELKPLLDFVEKNAKAIAAQLEKEGRIRMSEKLKKRLGWA